jgi:hypothetical protein
VKLHTKKFKDSKTSKYKNKKHNFFFEDPQNDKKKNQRFLNFKIQKQRTQFFLKTHKMTRRKIGNFRTSK